MRYQISHIGLANIHEGDVLVSNHPCAGGSHLPDMTVISPVFTPECKTPVFFLVNLMLFDIRETCGNHAGVRGVCVNISVCVCVCV